LRTAIKPLDQTLKLDTLHLNNTQELENRKESLREGRSNGRSEAPSSKKEGSHGRGDVQVEGRESELTV